MSPKSFTCPVCYKTSYHPVDVAQGFCGACNTFTRELSLAARLRMREKKDPNLWVKRWLRVDVDGELWELWRRGFWVFVEADAKPSEAMSLTLDALEGAHGPTKLTYWSDEDKCSAHGRSRCPWCSQNDGHHWCGKCDFYNLTGMHWDGCSNRLRFEDVKNL